MELVQQIQIMKAIQKIYSITQDFLHKVILYAPMIKMCNNFCTANS